MKIAAFDIDGTLLFPDGIAAADVAAIRAWQDAGHLAVAATGKSLSALQQVVEPRLPAAQSCGNLTDLGFASVV